MVLTNGFRCKIIIEDAGDALELHEVLLRAKFTAKTVHFLTEASIAELQKNDGSKLELGIRVTLFQAARSLTV